MAGGSLSAKARARSIAHRYGPVCALSATEQAVLGIRYDEEDDAAAETFLLRLGPGRAEALDQQPGVGQALAASSTGALFVLDAKGVLHCNGRRHKLPSSRTVVAFGEGVVLAGDDRLWMVSGDGTHVSEGPVVKARHLASSKAGLLAVVDDGRVLLFADPSTSPREVIINAGGHMAAVAIDDEGRIGAASGRSVLMGDVAGIAPVATAPFEVHCVALHHGRLMLSSRAHGLFFVDDDEGKLKVMPKKPSLRAHSLSVKDGMLVAASDLFVATSDDGIDFMTRDLAPFVRLAEQRMPRFVQSEDPVNV